MEKTLFNIIDICHSHKMETTFIRELHANGLIEMIILESEAYIDESQLPRLEKYANLYYDLQLNMEDSRTGRICSTVFVTYNKKSKPCEVWIRGICSYRDTAWPLRKSHSS